MPLSPQDCAVCCVLPGKFVRLVMGNGFNITYSLGHTLRKTLRRQMSKWMVDGNVKVTL